MIGREILTVAEMGEADRRAEADGTPVSVLMERAGQAVAVAVRERFPDGTVLVLCGPGDNGGDGFVAARLLAEGGRSVRVAASGDIARMKGAAGEAARAWTGPVSRLSEITLDGVAVVVDALFGAGLHRPLTAQPLAALKQVEAKGLPIVAVDLPSGLSGDTAQPLGFAPCATMTVTFHRKKLAHVLDPGKGYCGEVRVCDIGLEPPAPGAGRLNENGPSLWLKYFPWPKSSTHKAERGRMMVVSGHAWNTGAARLAARGGLRIGAGLVTLLSPLDALMSNAAHLEALMLKPFESDAELHELADDADVVVIGPAAGVTPETRLNFMALARTGAALVVDADVFTVFRDSPDDFFAALDRDDVLTPHPGEFERVFPGLLKKSPNRVEAARRAAEIAGAVVLLKGDDTVIAAPNGRAVVNTNATPWLATAGSGDVLAGLTAGLIAQGMESFEAACAAAWIHAEAGRGFGPGLISEDLPERAPGVLAELLRMAVEGGAPDLRRLMAADQA
ncbi:NAD(P)H-hydrate dehydratase [Caulobacter sp. S45]|uniref:NAD(P)H-hydrate dehydratase n=1 Tax=Caulobacter sp. S45 TaxID=1641861 RepID=UPI0020B13ECF|nr:NAD(P)H-hydrate dehydratase [Caulobacter sp. S45]